MDLSAAKQAGFALAALLADDRALGHVRAALSPADAQALARALDASPGSRSAQVAALLAWVRPQLAALPPGLPPGMAALLAARLPRALGRMALAEAPALRADFVASAALTPCLLRITRRLAAGASPC